MGECLSVTTSSSLETQNACTPISRKSKQPPMHTTTSSATLPTATTWGNEVPMIDAPCHNNSLRAPIDGQPPSPHLHPLISIVSCGAPSCAAPLRKKSAEQIGSTPTRLVTFMDQIPIEGSSRSSLSEHSRQLRSLSGPPPDHALSPQMKKFQQDAERFSSISSDPECTTTSSTECERKEEGDP